MFANKVCPGPYLGGRLPLIIEQVNIRLGKTIKPALTAPDAIEILHRNGVIGTPAYWLENYTKVQYLDQLIINMANKGIPMGE